jgi:hypothetical protein
MSNLWIILVVCWCCDDICIEVLLLWYGVLYREFNNVLVVIMFVFWQCCVYGWVMVIIAVLWKMKSFEVRKWCFRVVWRFGLWLREDKCWGNIRVQAFFEYEKCLALYFNQMKLSCSIERVIMTKCAFWVCLIKMRVCWIEKETQRLNQTFNNSLVDWNCNTPKLFYL